MQSFVGVAGGALDGQVARLAVDVHVFQLVDQGDVVGECVEPHAADAG